MKPPCGNCEMKGCGKHHDENAKLIQNSERKQNASRKLKKKQVTTAR